MTVLEHLRYPDKFINALPTLINPFGAIYVTVPNITCLASRLLGIHWPYFIFGEHLSIPSKQGLQILLNRSIADNEWKCVHSNIPTALVLDIILPYPLVHYIDYFNLKIKLPRLIERLSICIPTGIIEGTISFKRI